jgi:hypothetical protein
MIILSGFIVGLLFGFVLTRGYFCQFSGLSDALMFKNFRIIKATIWAVLIAMIGFHLMASLEIITLNPKPFFGAASIIGGAVFGLGMTLVGACVGGTTFKMGTGLISYFIAGIGIALGGLSAAEGFLKPIRLALQDTTKVMIKGANPTLSSLLGLNPWILVLILAVIFIWLLLKLRTEEKEPRPEATFFARLFKLRWSPALTGVAIGIIGMIAFVASAAAGRNYPLGIVEGYIPILKSFLTGSFTLSWMYLLIPGIILGSTIAAFVAGEFRWRLPNWKTAVIMLIGGFLMGGGAVFAAGCNVTHILSGIPQLSVGSIVSGIAIFGAVYLIDYFRFIRKKQS